MNAEISDAELKELKRLMTANRGVFRTRTAKMAERFLDALLHARNLLTVVSEAQRESQAKALELKKRCEALEQELAALRAKGR